MGIVGAGEIRVLFIGNSYTYVNDLPTIFTDLAASMGRTVHVESNTAGGYTLEGHSNPEDPVGSKTRAMLKEAWDYVILQENSMGAVTKEFREERMYPAVRELVGLVDGTGGKTVLYMTWGRRWGKSESGCPDYWDMQGKIAMGYDAIGVELGALVAPIGLGWARARTLEPGIDLWTEDNSHPSPLGSLIAAYILYGTIYGEDPTGSGFSNGLAGPSVETVRRAALDTLRERNLLK